MSEMTKPPKASGPLIPEVTLAALEELGLVLKAIYLRLRSEGYVLRDGELIRLT